MQAHLVDFFMFMLFTSHLVFHFMKTIVWYQYCQGGGEGGAINLFEKGLGGS